jgi:hypothetical protein
VLSDGKVVGRIYERGGVGTPPDMLRFWSSMIVPAGSSGTIPDGVRASRGRLAVG